MAAGTSLTARRVVFAPLDGGGRVEAVIDRLCGAINLGLIAEGEQLPRETELASSLGVSTVTLREALSQLRNLGLVETRRGRGGGSFANGTTELAEQRSLTRLRELGAYEIRDMGDVGVAMAGMAARRAAERAAVDQLARLGELVDHITPAATPGERRQAHGRFRVEVAAAAQSVRLATLEMNHQTEYGELLWVIPSGDEAAAEEFRRRTVAGHRQLLAAVTAGNADQARAAAERVAEDCAARLLDLHYLLAED